MQTKRAKHIADILLGVGLLLCPIRQWAKQATNGRALP